eukprot:1179898-Prorocentrum_minimum.AAC.2
MLRRNKAQWSVYTVYTTLIQRQQLSYVLDFVHVEVPLPAFGPISHALLVNEHAVYSSECRKLACACSRSGYVRRHALQV